MANEWDEARHTLRTSLGAMFDIWVAPVRLHGVNHRASPPRVHLVAPNEMFRSWVDSSYRTDIESALRGVLGTNDVALHLWVEGAALPEPTATASAPARSVDAPTAPEPVISESTPSAPVASEPVPPQLFPDLTPLPPAPLPGRAGVPEDMQLRTAARQAPRAAPPPQPGLFSAPRRPVEPAASTRGHDRSPRPSAVPSRHADQPGAAPSKSMSSSLPAGKTFDHFVVGTCNQFAHAAARSVADDPTGVRYNPLFIYGGTGLGKTHLMVSVGHHRCTVAPSTRVLYVTAEQFTNELIESLRFKRMTEFRDKYRHGVDLLLMDDVQFVTGKERTQEELFHTFEWLRERGKQIVFTADVLPREIRGFEPRLRTRCESGMLADMQPPDLETLMAILHEKAEASGRVLPAEVAAYIAARVRGSIREIEGVVHRIDALCTLYRQEPTIGFLRAHLGHVLPDGPPSPEPDDIIREVASAFQVQVGQLLGRGRARHIARSRHVAMFLVRKHTGASYPEIGRRFRRDHTTIQHGYRKIEAALQTDMELRQVVHVIERTIGC